MSNTKKKILVFVDWYLPGFKAGGPIRSCVGLVDRLSFKYDIKIVTGNTDLKDTVPYKGIQFNAWTISDKDTNIFYCTKSFLNIKNIKKLINSENPDIIYLNSMYSVNFTLLPLLILRLIKFKGKVIIAPRGMLSTGALALKSLKKRIFLTASKALGLFNKVSFHASTKVEIEEISNVFGSNAKHHLAINLTPKSIVHLLMKQKEKGIVDLVFLGRISKVKNLLQSLKLLKLIDPNFHIKYNIFGPSEDIKYFNMCKEVATSMPSNIEVQFKGEASNNEVNSILKNHHFLYQLTNNENFGHAIVESFSAGCPVIISDKTPWSNLNSKYCGWDLDLNNETEIIRILNKVASMNQEEYNRYSQGAFKFSESINNNQIAINDHITMFGS